MEKYQSLFDADASQAGEEEAVLLPNMPDSKKPTSNQEPTLSDDTPTREDKNAISNEPSTINNEELTQEAPTPEPEPAPASTPHSSLLTPNSIESIPAQAPESAPAPHSSLLTQATIRQNQSPP